MFHFLLFGRGRGPRPMVASAQTAKNITRPRPFRSFCVGCCLGGGRVSSFLLFGTCFFFAVWAGCVLFFCCWGGGVLVFFCCLGGGRVFSFLLFVRVACFFFAVWAGCVLVFCCLGGGRFFFVAVWAGAGVHSLTGLPGSSLSDPTRKKTKQQNKNKHGFLDSSPPDSNMKCAWELGVGWLVGTAEKRKLPCSVKPL